MNLKLGTFSGIPLYLNLWTIVVGALFYIMSPQLWAIYCLVLFFVVLHEYGHCLAARYKNMNAVNVHVYPLGGIALITREQEYDPNDELFVTLAGPAVNFILGSIFALILFVIQSKLIVLLAVLNYSLFLFNMIIVFPLDGGKILRALLAFKLGQLKATQYAARIGQTLAVLLIIPCVYYGAWSGALIFAFTIFMAQAELSHVKFECAFIIYKDRASEILNKEITSLQQMTEELEKIQDSNLKEKLGVDYILPILKEKTEPKT